MEPRLINCFLRSLLLAVAFSAGTYLIIWGLAAIHQESDVPSGAALPLALWTFPAFFFGSLIVFVIRRSGARRH